MVVVAAAAAADGSSSTGLRNGLNCPSPSDGKDSREGIVIAFGRGSFRASKVTSASLKCEDTFGLCFLSFDRSAGAIFLKFKNNAF